MPKGTLPNAQQRRTLKRRIALVEYDDGRIQELNMGAPMVEYIATTMGFTADNPLSAFAQLWVAADKPGANGSVLTIESATPLIEAWLATIVNLEVNEDPSVPPTKPRGTSSTSAG